MTVWEWLDSAGKNYVDLQEIAECSVATAYRILHRKTEPSIAAGIRLRKASDNAIAWEDMTAIRD